jgi:hypothetical protein
MAVQLHVFLFSAADDGEWSALRSDCCTFRKESPVPVEKGTEWAPKRTSTLWRRENPLLLLRIEPWS